MKKTGLALLAVCLGAMACSKQSSSNDSSQTDNQGFNYDFIAVNDWLPGTQWTVQRQYMKFVGEEWDWMQFHSSYDESQLGPIANNNCRDTITFGNGTYSVFGDVTTNATNGEYNVADSVVLLYPLRVYQICADSMIVWGWHDCSYTQDIQQWLFTKVE